MNIKLVRLTTGEEVVCDLEIDESNDGTFYNITNPVILIPDRGKNLMLLPWLPYAKLEDDTVRVNEKSIMFVVDAHEELAKEYKAQVTGVEPIIAPSKQVVTPGDIAGSIGGPVGR